MEINEIAIINLVEEIRLIEDIWIRLFASRAIRAAPGEYWKKPSGKHEGHHPSDEHGDWGNLMHVKRAITVAKAFAEHLGLDQLRKDMLYCGLLIHDLGKYGIDGKLDLITPDHPRLVREVVKDIEPCYFIANILGIAETHMGAWGIIWPRGELEWLGHYCDFIASRADSNIPVTLEVDR